MPKLTAFNCIISCFKCNFIPKYNVQRETQKGKTGAVSLHFGITGTLQINNYLNYEMERYGITVFKRDHATSNRAAVKNLFHLSKEFILVLDIE